MTNKGMYEIIMVFMLIVIMVFSILFLISMNAKSSMLFATVQKTVESPKDAITVKDALFTCHRIDYLDERLMASPCVAKQMGRGFRITQMPLNSCAPTVWDFAFGDHTQTIPFYVSVSDNSSQRCIARLEVYLP